MQPGTAPIAILGGSGFVGSRLATQLAERDLPFRIGDLRANEAFPGQFHLCDVRDAASMKSVLSGCRVIINLAAEHRDDVRPISRYHVTNVVGAKEVCTAAKEANIKTLVFTSSVAVYGFHDHPVSESGPFRPFNPYGETKLDAEKVYLDWANEDPERSLVIIRPTVIFGEGNRGNVYNLLRQVASGRFLMIGDGSNRKSMAYVGNVAAVIVHALTFGPGIHIFNYVDTPDLNMRELVDITNQELKRKAFKLPRIPISVAMAGGHLLDLISTVTGKRFPVSAIRIRKFCENTQFDASHIRNLGFTPPYDLVEGLKRTLTVEFGRSRD